MQLSPHFSDQEYGVVGASPQVIANATQHANVLMEPIRAKFGPVNCHDGLRTPAENAECGGVKDSQHLFLGENSALDFDALPNPYQAVFDWIRLESGLPFDQVIPWGLHPVNCTRRLGYGSRGCSQRSLSEPIGSRGLAASPAID